MGRGRLAAAAPVVVAASIESLFRQSIIKAVAIGVLILLGLGIARLAGLL
jgi:hypothetical protein